MTVFALLVVALLAFWTGLAVGVALVREREEIELERLETELEP